MYRILFIGIVYWYIVCSDIGIALGLSVVRYPCLFFASGGAPGGFAYVDQDPDPFRLL